MSICVVLKLTEISNRRGPRELDSKTRGELKVSFLLGVVIGKARGSTAKALLGLESGLGSDVRVRVRVRVGRRVRINFVVRVVKVHVHSPHMRAV